MNEEAKLDSALERVDDVLAASLRREEAQRMRKAFARMWAAVAVSFVIGTAGGAVGMRMWMGGHDAGPVAKDVKPAVEETPTTGPCEVKWGNEWRRATIINQERGIFLVKYDAPWSDSLFNEWVTPERIRAVGSNKDNGEYARPTPHGKKPGEMTTQRAPGTAPMDFKMSPARGNGMGV